MATELSTLFASSVRDIVPDVLRRHLAYRYREHGCDWIWEDEGRRLESSLHRLFVAAVDLLDHGFIGFQASARPRRSGGVQLSLHLSGTGRQVPEARIGEVLAVLELADEHRPDRGTRLQRATGICPLMRAAVNFAREPAAGFVFSVHYPLHRAEHDAQGAPPLLLRKAPRLWLVEEDPINAAAMTEQAQDAGWAVSVFDSVATLVRRHRARSGSEALPALLLMVALPMLTSAAARTARELLPARVVCIYAVAAGTAPVPHIRRLEVRVHPLSALDWLSWLLALAPGADEPSGQTRPAPLTAADRSSVLISTTTRRAQRWPG